MLADNLQITDAGGYALPVDGGNLCGDLEAEQEDGPNQEDAKNDVSLQENVGDGFVEGGHDSAGYGDCGFGQGGICSPDYEFYAI